MQYFPKLHHLIRDNKARFQKLIDNIQSAGSLRARCARAYEAATYATRHNTDVFSSAEIEAPFLELAKLVEAPMSESYEEGTVLHVATEVYNVGGHSRCVERWVQLMSEQRHSCYLINQQAPVPARLTELVAERQGEILLADRTESMVARARKLRTFASRYQYVVLHTHMNDPVALIAFGTEAFKRPVILFNHADHIFWLGASVADYVADIGGSLHNLTVMRRGIPRAFVLRIPSEKTGMQASDQTKAREQLGIAPEQKMIFVSGHARKFDPTGKPDFADIIQQVAEVEPGVHFYLAGVSDKQELWAKLTPDVRARITFTGRLDYKTQYPLYLAAADLVINSYPVGGSTAIIDAIRAGKPLLALSIVGQPGFLEKSQSYCATVQELADKASRMLSDAEYRETLRRELFDNWQTENSPEAWADRCRKLYSLLPEYHRIYQIEPSLTDAGISDISLVTCMWTEPDSSWFKRARRWVFFKNKREGMLNILGVNFWRRKQEELVFRKEELIQPR